MGRPHLRKDIAPTLGLIPLDELTESDISCWVQRLVDSGAAAKTISNKQRFLSLALRAAAKAGATTRVVHAAIPARRTSAPPQPPTPA
jgi:hypothetical protein